MTTILEATEQRATQATRDRQAEQQLAVEAVKHDIGPQHYEQAKQFEPKLLAAVRDNYLPFFSKIAALSAHARPLPSFGSGYLRQLGELCSALPAQLRRGIDAYERLSFADLADQSKHGVDLNRRNSLIPLIRHDLHTYDGGLSGLEHLKGNLEQIIRESGWPGQPTTEEA